MDYNLLLDRLKNNKYKSLNLIYGEETYLIDKALHKVAEKIVTDMPELNFITLRGENLNFEELSGACDTFPILSERKLVLVKDFYLLKSSGKSEEEIKSSKEKGADDFKDIIENQNDTQNTTVLVFVIFGDIDKRKKLYNIIKKHGDIYHIERVERDDLSKWVKGLLAQNGKTIGSREISFFIERSGYYEKNTKKTLYDLENEIKKLSSFLGEEKEVKIDDISALAPKSLENDIFKLINACSIKNSGETLRIYSDLLLANESSFGILGMVSKQIKNILLTKELLGKYRDSKVIASELKIHEFTVKQCMKYASQLDNDTLIKAFDRCLNAELSIKSGKMNDRLALELLFVNLLD